MNREVQLPSNFNPPKGPSSLDRLTNADFKIDWRGYIMETIPDNEIIKLLDFAKAKGLNIDPSLTEPENIKKYFFKEIEPSFLKEAIDNDIVSFCENWYRGRYVDSSGNIFTIYFEGTLKNSIFTMHHTTYTYGLPPPPGYTPPIAAGWGMYNNNDKTSLRENMKIIDQIRGNITVDQPVAMTPMAAVQPVTEVHSPNYSIMGTTSAATSRPVAISSVPVSQTEASQQPVGIQPVTESHGGVLPVLQTSPTAEPTAGPDATTAAGPDATTAAEPAAAEPAAAEPAAAEPAAAEPAATTAASILGSSHKVDNTQGGMPSGENTDMLTFDRRRKKRGGGGNKKLKYTNKRNTRRKKNIKTRNKKKRKSNKRKKKKTRGINRG